MNTLKQTNNNNVQRNKRTHNQSLLEKRNNIQKNKQRQSMISKKQASSIVCVVLTLWQPSYTRALIQSRGRTDLNSRRSNSHTFSAIQSRSGIRSRQPSFGISISSLHYRDYELNDDGDKAQRQKEQESIQSLPREQSNHADDQRNHHDDHHISGFFHTLWTSRKTKRGAKLYALQVKEKEEEEKQQYVLDEYLESIDRRYRRLHEEDEKPSNNKKNDKNTGGFSSVYQWLTRTDSSSSEFEEQRKQDDAIYVLGLADLASTRLLQRHHLPVPEHKLNKPVTLDVAFKHQDASDLVKDLDVSVPVNKREGQSSLFAAVASTSASKYLIRQVILTIHMLRVLGKAAARAFGSFISFLSNTSGSKQSLLVATAMGAAIFAFSVSIVRTVTKA